MPFKRGLDDKFINLLHAEADKAGWWRDVLNDKTLLIGVRENYLNVYWQGQALFTVRQAAGTLRVTTHKKFLLDPDLEAQVRLKDDSFEIEGLRNRGFMSQFESGKTPPKLNTLPKMKRAAQVFAGDEKKGCHVIAQRNAMVVDFEVALPADAGAAGGMGKVDLACFEEYDKGVRLTFWEAKHFANPELKAQDGDPPVVCQIERYAAWIVQHRAELKDSYRCIARNLTAFETMGWKRTLHPSIKAVAGGTKPLSLNDVPPVGLLYFGYDQDQSTGQVWTRHRTKLMDYTKPPARIGRIFSAGNAAGIRLPERAKDYPVEIPVADDDEPDA
jgi:hypothetical protein